MVLQNENLDNSAGRAANALYSNVKKTRITRENFGVPSRWRNGVPPGVIS